MKDNITKQDMQYTNEKIDLGSLDAAYVTLLIFTSSTLLAIILTFKEFIFSITPLMILTCIPFFAVLISLYYEIRSVFNGKIGDKFWSFFILICYGVLIIFVAISNLLYYFNPDIFSKMAFGGMILKFIFVGIFIWVLTYYPKKLKHWFNKRFPIHIEKEKVNYLKTKEEENIMSKNEDSLRLEYEHHRTFAFAEFAAILVLAFGVISNIHGMKMYVILIFTLTFIALLIGFIASFKSMNRIYSSLKRLYKNKK